METTVWLFGLSIMFGIFAYLCNVQLAAETGIIRPFTGTGRENEIAFSQRRDELYWGAVLFMVIAGALFLLFLIGYPPPPAYRRAAQTFGFCFPFLISVIPYFVGTEKRKER